MGLYKQQLEKSWDPNQSDISGTEWHFNAEPELQLIRKKLKKFYQKKLVEAYKRATGKKLAAPEKYIDPRFQYIFGRAQNVDPEILKQLKEDDYNRLGGWSSGGDKNLDPGVIMDALDLINANGYIPLDYTTTGLDRDGSYRVKKPFKLTY